MSNKVAVVTGSNKGIGKAVVKGLAPKFNGIVYLTSRNEDLGKKALEELKSEGIKNIRYHQLNISDEASIERFAKHIKNEHGGLDVLINNAAIALPYDANDLVTFSKNARETLKVNLFDTLTVCKHLFPLLREHARVVNIASRLGLLLHLTKKELRDKFSADNATEQDIIGLVNQYLNSIENGKYVELGYPATPYSAYSVSKIALIAITRIQQKKFDKDSTTRNKDIIVSSLCPGYVDTDMNNHQGQLTVEQGAETPIHLALLPENASVPKGAFWAESKPFDWFTEDFKLP